MLCFSFIVFFVLDPMATPPSESSARGSRGHSLFERQARLHVHGVDQTSESQLADLQLNELPFLKASSSIPSTANVILSTGAPHHYQPAHTSPSASSHRLVFASETNRRSSNENVQLISIQPRPESTYIKETSQPSIINKPAEKLMETDFPLLENDNSPEMEPTEGSETLPLNDLTCAAVVEQAFHYLEVHDDDDDVIHQNDDHPTSDRSDSFDNDQGESVATIDLPPNSTHQEQSNDSKLERSAHYSHPLIELSSRIQLNKSKREAERERETEEKSLLSFLPSRLH
jgi:hypothetical protein